MKEKLLIKSNGQWELSKSDNKTKSIYSKTVKMYEDSHSSESINKFVNDNKQHINVHHLMTMAQDPSLGGRSSDTADLGENFNAKSVIAHSHAHKNAMTHLTSSVADHISPEEYADLRIGPNIANMTDSTGEEHFQSHEPTKSQYLSVVNRLNDWHKDNKFNQHWGPEGEGAFSSPDEHVKYALTSVKNDHLKDDQSVKDAHVKLNTTLENLNPKKPTLLN